GNDLAPLRRPSLGFPRLPEGRSQPAHDSSAPMDDSSAARGAPGRARYSIAMSRRSVAIAIACAVAGALQAGHSLAYGRLDSLGVAYGIATTAIELVVLSAIYDRLRSLVVISGVALALSIAAVFAGSALAGRAVPMPVPVVAQIGLYDGVLAVG